MTSDDQDSRAKKLGALSKVPQRLSKLRGAPPEMLDDPSGDKVFHAIVKVHKKDYVPHGIKPVSEVTPEMFTTRLRYAEILRLDADPLVVSVELSRPIGPAKS